MVSLTIYIISFVIIIGIIGSITVFFSNSSKEVNIASGASSEYNKFNLYILEQIENGYDIYKIYGEASGEDASADGKEQYVTFSNGTNLNTFVKLGNILYFNKMKLCENVDEFKVEHTIAVNGKDVLKTYLQINGILYTTDYVIK